jgi:hypothetical protein
VTRPCAWSTVALVMTGIRLGASASSDQYEYRVMSPHVGNSPDEPTRSFAECTTNCRVNHLHRAAVQVQPRSAGVAQPTRASRAAAEFTAALIGRGAAPDAVRLLRVQRKPQARLAYPATGTDRLGRLDLVDGESRLRYGKEKVGIGTETGTCLAPAKARGGNYSGHDAPASHRCLG